jgi:hypothetical protein
MVAVKPSATLTGLGGRSKFLWLSQGEGLRGGEAWAMVPAERKMLWK